MKNVSLSLTPYTTLAILSFLREWINEDNKNLPEYQAIHGAVDEYAQQVYKNMTDDQSDDCIMENEINKITGKCPEK